MDYEAPISDIILLSNVPFSSSPDWDTEIDPFN